MNNFVFVIIRYDKGRIRMHVSDVINKVAATCFIIEYACPFKIALCNGLIIAVFSGSGMPRIREGIKFRNVAVISIAINATIIKIGMRVVESFS